MQSFMFLAIGIGALLVALALTLVLLRLNRTLFVIEEMLGTVTQEMRDTLPEVREGLSTVNEITSGMNLALQSAGSGLERAGIGLRRLLREWALDLDAAWYGVQVAGQSLSASYEQLEAAQRGAELTSRAFPPAEPVDTSVSAADFVGIKGEDEHGE